ncbi:MAG TPA: organic hydroperoxide resistance protein [Bacillota bacterium]|nr:organic hydroperoxide resistance protein [Bacillota bacterium]
MKVLYESTVTNTGGRSGRAVSDDGNLALDIVRPAEQKEKGLPGTNPEQLFAAGYSSCFNGALGRVLRLNGVRYESSTVTATVTLYEDPEDNGFRIGVKMRASVKGLSREEAKKYIELAHTVCPYSKAIKGNVEVELEVLE